MTIFASSINILYALSYLNYLCLQPHLNHGYPTHSMSAISRPRPWHHRTQPGSPCTGARPAPSWPGSWSC